MGDGGLTALTARKKYLSRAASAYHGQLRTLGEEHREVVSTYLREHGIMDWDIINKYQLGFVTSPLAGDHRFTGMLSIPYLSRSGVDSIRFRNLRQGGGSKMAVHTGQGHRLYNTRALFDPGETIGITEGEVDAIAATERLGLPTVGVPGAKNWDSLHWKPHFKNFTRVIIFADGDTEDNELAGQAFAKMIAEDLGWRGVQVQCPTGEDVASMVAKDRAAELQAMYSTSNEEDE